MVRGFGSFGPSGEWDLGGAVVRVEVAEGRVVTGGGREQGRPGALVCMVRNEVE